MNESPAPGEQSPELERAEVMVDAMAQTVASYATRLRHNLIKSVALAREEADDILAEAREMNREQQT